MQPSATEAVPRKRTALGDVSNVTKSQGAEAREIKKPLGAAKGSHPTGIQKSTRVDSKRSTLVAKDRSSTSNDLKRPASVVSSIAGNAAKKRASASSRSSGTDSVKDGEDIEPDENSGVKIVTETIKTTITKPDGVKVEQEVKREVDIMDATAFARQQWLEEHIDIMDKEDEHDPLMVGEYVYEIVDYMKELEVTTAPNPSYMENQVQLEWRMRGVLIDWLLEVHTKFHLLPETLYLTVNIIDRFLSRKVIQLDRLQLVGVTAMFIAAKYEEVLSPHIGNFSHVADDGFTDAEILSAERFVLNTLQYDLSFPNPMHFMRRISKADGYDIQTRTLAKYLLEISIIDYRFLEYPPSLNAAAAMQLARMILDKGVWVSSGDIAYAG